MKRSLLIAAAMLTLASNAGGAELTLVVHNTKTVWTVPCQHITGYTPVPNTVAYQVGIEGMPVRAYDPVNLNINLATEIEACWAASKPDGR